MSSLSPNPSAKPKLTSLKQKRSKGYNAVGHQKLPPFFVFISIKTCLKEEVELIQKGDNYELLQEGDNFKTLNIY